MTQVKLFESNENTKYIEVQINNWLKSKENITILDIKVAMAGNGGTSINTIYTIIYKEI